MSNLKSLAKDTVIYGASSIVGRFLNYLLVPLYTATFSASGGGYGVVTHIYSLTALVLVLLICGMETGFFRFANKKDEDAQTVYSSVLIFVGSIALTFALLCLLFLKPLSTALGYAKNPEFIGIMVIVVSLDAFLSIPFAYLRYQKRPIRFASIKLAFIALNIGLNLFFLLLCPWLNTHYPASISWFYHPGYGVGYVFIANLIGVLVQFLLLIPQLRVKYRFNKALMKRIFIYTFPLLVLGVVGILNQTIDKIIFPYVFADKAKADVQLGIYGAATKIAMIMAMFTQAFRYAYEPFVFGKSKEGDNRKVYALSMKYFYIFALFAFLAVMFYMDILRYIIAPGYWAGLKVVPIVMAAEILMGIYFNLSFWYKLIDETRWGAYFSLVGCVCIVSLNVIFIPIYGYIACAWAGFIGYAVITLLSYVIGQRKYPIDYDLKSMGSYTLLASVLYVISLLLVPSNQWIRLGFRTILFGVFVIYTIRKDFPLNQIPLLNRLLRRK